MIPTFLVAIHGSRGSFDPAAGPMMALVEVEDGPDQVLVDRERDRCRVERTPARRDLDKWSSPVGLILAARRGVWGLSIVEDRYLGDTAGPPDLARSARRPECLRAPREPVPSYGRYLRASVPADLCSCLRCRDLVIVRRSPWGGRPVALAAPGRLYRKCLRCLPWRSGCQGPGLAAVEHGRDCPAFRLGEAVPIPTGRRSRGLLLAQLVRRLHRRDRSRIGEGGPA